jgi:hypothetical protein
MMRTGQNNVAAVFPGGMGSLCAANLSRSESRPDNIAIISSIGTVWVMISERRDEQKQHYTWKVVVYHHVEEGAIFVAG